VTYVADIMALVCFSVSSLGVINNVLKPSLVQRHIQLCLYKSWAWPISCYRSKVCTI